MTYMGFRDGNNSAELAAAVGMPWTFLFKARKYGVYPTRPALEELQTRSKFGLYGLPLNEKLATIEGAVR